MGGCQSRAKNRAKLLARQEQNDVQCGPCRQVPHPVWGAFRFQRLELLGRGAGGVTYLCRCLDSDEAVAVKMIKRPIPMMLGHLMMREIMIQAELGSGHINVVGVKEVVLTDTHLGIVMECASGGNLARYLMDKMRHQSSAPGLLLDEAEASYLFRQLVSAVEFCHDNCIAHRDIKLDNTLLDHNSPPTLKLCDFGLSRCWGEEGPEMHTVAGTPCYMSPQLTSHQLTGYRHPGYDATKSDVWSMAVVLFVMLLGRFPFDGEGSKGGSHKETLQFVFSQQQAMKCWREIPFVARYIAFMSPELLDLLDRMFEFDAAKRISISEISHHAWCTQALPPKMQTAWDRMQRLQLARRLNFFPARSHARSYSCPSNALNPVGIQQAQHAPHLRTGANCPQDLQQRSCHPALPICTRHGPRQHHAAESYFPTTENSAECPGQHLMDESCARPLSADQCRRGSEVDTVFEHVPRDARTQTYAHVCPASRGKRCQCYDGYNSTPEQCAEELQQLLTQASLPAPYQDPDAVLSRMQLLKVLCHVPCHKIPSITYFKESNKVPCKTLGNPAHSASNKSIPSIIGTQIFPDVSPRTPHTCTSITATSQPVAQSPPLSKHVPLPAVPCAISKHSWDAQTSTDSSSPLESISSDHGGFADDERTLSSAASCSSGDAEPSDYQPKPQQSANPGEPGLNAAAEGAGITIPRIALPPPISTRGLRSTPRNDIHADRDQLIDDAASAPPNACGLAVESSQALLKLPDTVPAPVTSRTSTFTDFSPSSTKPADLAACARCQESTRRQTSSTTFMSVSCSAVYGSGVGGDTVMAKAELQDMISSLSMRPCGVRDVQGHRELLEKAVLGCTPLC